MSRKDAILSLRQVLVKRRDALRKALAGDLSLLKELRAQTSGDMVDAALDSVQDEISSQLAEVESRELTRIEYALEHMRNGHYGVCEACGTSIPMARLSALPYATHCIKCQREMERQGTSGSAADVDWSRLLDVSGGESELSINDIELDVS
jgi:DnaK suppressor protein